MRKKKMLIGVLTAAMLLGNVSPAMVQGAQAAEVTEVPAETETEELATESAVTEVEETTETAVTETEENQPSEIAVTETNEERLTEELATEVVPTETEEAATEIEVTETEEEETTEDAYKTADAKADKNGFIIEDGVLTDYTGSGGDIVIPKGVTKIGKDAYYSSVVGHLVYEAVFGNNVTSITIPKSVNEIVYSSNYMVLYAGEPWKTAWNPFAGCENLKRIIVEEGNSNFKAIDGILYEKNKDSESGAETLSLFVCPRSIEKEDIVVPSNVVEIKAGAFKGCKGIKTVSLPNSVDYIGTQTFYECESLEKVIMNTDEIGVGDGAFDYCINLTDISGVTVNYIGQRAFSFCKKLEFANVTAEIINDYAFVGCSSLKKLPAKMKKVGCGAFAGCSSLEKISLPEGLESIGLRAFSGTKATSITIPASVTFINTDSTYRSGGRDYEGKGAFSEMFFLQKIEVAKGNANYKSIDGILYNKDGTKLYVCPYRKEGVVTIPDTVENVKELAFGECRRITEVIFSDTIKEIPSGCFKDCSELEKIKISKSVTDIKDNDLRRWAGNDTFRACNRLQDIEVASDNQSYKSIEGILYNKQGTELYYCPNGKTGNIDVPNSVHTIGKKAFTISGGYTMDAYIQGGYQETVNYEGVIIPDSVTEIKEGNEFTMIYCNPGSYAESYAKEHNIPYKNGLPQANQTITASDFTKTYGDAAFSINAVTSGDGKLSYVSDNESVAKVDAKGKVTLTGVGTAHITITASETKNYSGAKKVITITVKKKDSAGNTDNNSKLITAKNITKTYGCKAFSLGAKSKSGGKLTYSVADKKVATVDKKGKVTVKGYGQTKITITSAAKGKYPKAKKTITLTVKPVKTRIASVKSTKSKNMVVKWKKDTKATGYVIQYSTDKKFKKGVKTVTITKNKTTSKTIGKLKGGKNYYVRVCTYKKSNGKQIKGSYSAVKSVKVKK